MTEIGRIAIIAAFAMTAYCALAPILGARIGLPELQTSARRGVLVVCGLVSIASIALLYAILSHNFQLSYVYQYSSRDMSTFYLISSFWAGNQGSLLLWALVLSVFSVVVLIQTRRQNRELAPYVLSILMVVEFFFLILIVFVADPFYRTAGVPPDGFGLNPLLENPGMMFHPTTLYLGYVGFTIPFAFALAALITGRLSSQWIKSTRRWALAAWLFLGLGNLLGAQWAYLELGWGGYWAWDPVENASFMPWLVATAYLHSVMIQERRGMLKVWNMALIMATFLLIIFGTFLTRSGVLSSVHSFGQSNIGPFFLAFMGITLIACIGLVIYRLPLLRSDSELDSLVSRESSFLLNNLIFVGAAFAIFLGTIFPLISEAVRGVKITVGPPFFNTINSPIFLTLIALMGICPLIGWRRASRDNLIRNFLYPSLAAAIASVILFWAGIKQSYVLFIFFLCLFVVFTILLEVLRGTRARHRTTGRNYAAALVNLIWRNKPRYGGYVVHLGIILIAVGIVSSSVYKAEESATLAYGESMYINDYALTYEDLTSYPTATKVVVTATLSVYNGKGDKLGVVAPAKIFHQRQEQPVTEVAIRTTLREDLYVILTGWEGEMATFKVFVNPMVVWMWIGGGVLLVGTVVAFWPDAREKRKTLARVSTPAPDSERTGPDET